MNTLTTRFSGDTDAQTRSARPLRLLAIGAALVVNVLILLVGRLVTGELPVAPIDGEDQSIGVGQVIVMTLVSGFVAWGLLALLERFTSRAVEIWTAIAVIT